MTIAKIIANWLELSEDEKWELVNDIADNALELIGLDGMETQHPELKLAMCTYLHGLYDARYRWKTSS